MIPMDTILSLNTSSFSSWLTGNNCITLYNASSNSDIIARFYPYFSFIQCLWIPFYSYYFALLYISQ